MENRMMQSMLLDFYGELLTERQRSCYDLHVNEDLSLSEIAEQSGISRQGVWDNIRRAEQALREIEEKTGLVRRFTALRSGSWPPWRKASPRSSGTPSGASARS